MNIKKSLLMLSGVVLLAGSMALSSCSAEPDDSDLYTFTGETIEDFITNNEADFSNFNYILRRAGYDRILSSYGTYTCFLPTNDAVKAYVQKLYDDPGAIFPHNGMPELSASQAKNVPVENLTDSLCRAIAMYHVSAVTYKTSQLGNNRGVSPISGPQINTTVDENGNTVLNGESVITMPDYEVVNGFVHVVNAVIPRANKLVVTDILKDGRFNIFAEALRKTGLDKMLEQRKKADLKETLPEVTPGEDGYSGYWVTKEPSDIKFTIFAETDEVLKANRINDVEALVKYAAECYEKCASGTADTGTEGWYDWYRNNNITVDTDPEGDFTKENHVLNMFIRYHILPFGVARNSLTIDQCVYDKGGWNGDSYDYYETQLPKTLLKVWYVKNEGRYYINRYVTNNTMTDGVGAAVESMGSNHEVRNTGAWIDVDNVITSLNGYIYPIDKVLVYNDEVANGVLNERMRFDVLSMLGETMSSDFRGMFCQDLVSRSGKADVARVRFPVDYFDNVVVYNGNKTKLDMNLIANPGENAYLLYKGDSFQGKGVYDFALKLPPVPDGTYELRVAATNFGNRGSMMQFYLGESSDVASMKPIDIPIDLRLPTNTAPDKPGDEDAARLRAIGYVEIEDQKNYPDAYEDRGVESDKAMRAHGYMRDGLSIVKENDRTYGYKPRKMNARYAGYQLRRILTRENLAQRDYWLRVKSVLPKYDDKKFQLDYIELVPVTVADGTGNMREDLY